MCGIAGAAGLDVPPDVARAVVDGMVRRMRHRGPDAMGVAAHGDVAIGTARLAIVDVAHGHQPMSNEDGSITLVYNGEVYNAPALRRDLEARGVQFRTRSDTEVILRLYEQAPEHVEELLVGMWAFAIHDRRRRQLVLSRDRFGIKPLFIADAGSAIAFASELRCFDRALRPFSRLFVIDHDAAHAMLSWNHVPENRTIYQGVRRLPPATRLTIDLVTGTRRTDTYWQLRPSKESVRVRSLEEASNLVGSMLRRAVRQHLESDVPVATFLSGGIDSSLMAAMAHQASPDPITAYTIAFEEERFDESRYARRVAAKIGIPLNVITVSEEKACATLADALLACDEPLGDPSSLATYLLSQQVGARFKVALAGDGGDEAFAGYKRHVLTRMRRPLANVPRVRDSLGRVLGCGRLGAGALRNDRRDGWHGLLRKWRRIAATLEGSDAEAYVRFTQFASLARTAMLMRSSTSARFLEQEACQRFSEAHGTELQKSMAADLWGSTCNDMLVKVDRMSMAHHLEVRVPFLDHRVVECGIGLPDAYTLGESAHSVLGKRVLRTLYARYFGAELASRKKHGFDVPVQQWLLGPLNVACERLFEKRRLDRFGILSSGELSDGGYQRWIRSDPTIAWHAFVLAAWCEAVLGDGAEALRALLDTAEGVGAAA